VGAARLSGFEVEAAASFRWGVPVWIDASYARLEARDGTGDPTTGGKQLVGRADHTFFAEAALAPGRWVFAGGTRGVSAVPLTAANTKWQEGYALAHARLRYEAWASVRLELEVRNLFDISYEDVRGYPAVGREAVVGIHLSPGGRAR
jgi:outer membrane cobalamin receptor